MTMLPSRLPLIQAPMVGSLACAAGLRDAFPQAI